jgi:predicted nuclease of predicted toxin-antitoxin system
MKLKLDENLGTRGQQILEQASHDVATVASQNMTAALDDEVIQACHREGRALVTMDLDFANPLQFPPADYSGIAVLRLPDRASRAILETTVRALVEGLANEELSGHLWIVEPNRIRIHYPD